MKTKAMKWLISGWFLSVVIALTITTGCKKTGGSSGEANLVVETSPSANGHVETPAPGPDFPLKITIKSTMPASGVKIDITVKPDGGSVSFFTRAVTSSSAVNDFIITGSTVGIVNVVDITVTSVDKSSNQWKGNYKYSRK